MLHLSIFRTGLILLSVFLGVVFAAPNILSEDTLETLPDFISESRLVLGLDLQGGVQALYEVDQEDIAQVHLSQVVNDLRKLLRDARIGYAALEQENGKVSVTIRDPANYDRSKALVVENLINVSQSVVSLGAGPNLVLAEPGDNRLEISLTEAGLNELIERAASQSIEVVRRRIDQLGTTEPLIQRQGANRLLIQVPGLNDPERLDRVVGSTARLEFRLVNQTMSADQALRTSPPPSAEVLTGYNDPNELSLVEKQILVNGDELTDAQQTIDQRNNEPVVSFRLSPSGATKFGQISTVNVGKPFAIVLDNKVVSAPTIREPILGGTGQISGNFTIDQANDFALLLRSGALPAKLTLQDLRSVGANLGRDSVEAGKLAAVVGVIAVASIMLIVYGLLGLIANIALIANIVLIIALLSALGATLTLPGIAGIVLTVGMAVDSNVLIFERIREEYRASKGLLRSIEDGFTKAFNTILDANVTTLIAAIVLFAMGAGPVRGFAITLAIGISTTVFSAFNLTRLLVVLWVKWMNPKKLNV